MDLCFPFLLFSIFVLLDQQVSLFENIPYENTQHFTPHSYTAPPEPWRTKLLIWLCFLFLYSFPRCQTSVLVFRVVSAVSQIGAVYKSFPAVPVHQIPCNSDSSLFFGQHDSESPTSLFGFL